MSYETTCALIKPHIVEGDNAIHKITDIMSRYTNNGLSIGSIKCFRMNRLFVVNFYSEHVDKPYFDQDIVPAMTAGRTIALVLAGDDAIAKVRKINGATDPAKADPGTIRYDYGKEVKRNAVHASDSITSAVREIFLISQVYQ